MSEEPRYLIRAKISEGEVEDLRAELAELRAALATADAAGFSRGVEAAAEAFRLHERTGREWVMDSLWDNITREGVARIRALLPRVPS